MRDMNKQQALSYLNNIKEQVEESRELLLKLSQEYKGTNEKVSDWASQLVTYLDKFHNIVQNFMDYIQKEVE